MISRDVLSRGFLRLLGVGVWAACLLTACAGYDAAGEEAPFDAPANNAEVGSELGADAIAPTTMLLQEMVGTESGNPEIGGSTPQEESGTESGNPTRPPPEAMPAGVEPEPAEPVALPPEPAVAMPQVEPEPVRSPEPVDEPQPEPVTTPSVDTTGTAGGPVTNPMIPATNMPAVPGSAAPTSPPCDPGSCAATAAAEAAALSAPLAAPEPFEQASCEASGACTCGGPSFSVTLTTSEQESCLVWGRASCLYWSSEYLGCEVAEPATCGASCDQLWSRQVADAASTFVVRSSACVADSCRFILAAPGQCLLDGENEASTVVACELSDEELLSSF